MIAMLVQALLRTGESTTRRYIYRAASVSSQESKWHTIMSFVPTIQRHFAQFRKAERAVARLQSAIGPKSSIHTPVAAASAMLHKFRWSDSTSSSMLGTCKSFWNGASKKKESSTIDFRDGQARAFCATHPATGRCDNCEVGWNSTH